MTAPTTQHIFKRFDNEREHLRGLVLQMGDLARQQLDDAVTTLRAAEPHTAHQVIANDAKLNQLDLQADNEIIRLIAKRQPMARDLRELIAVGKIVAELERAGDEARKIAGLTLRFYATEANPPDAEILQDIFSLAESVAAMLTRSVQAFAELDLTVAAEVLAHGTKLDSQLQSILRRLSTFILEDARKVGHFVDIILGIRALERFGSHAKNIAGHVTFIQLGRDVRHEGDEAVIHAIQAKMGT